MPTTDPNNMKDADAQTLEESLREYVALLRTYDLSEADPDSLVRPLLAGVLARVSDLQHLNLAGPAEPHVMPFLSEIARATGEVEPEVRAKALGSQRLLIHIGAKSLADIISTRAALEGIGAPPDAPSRVAGHFARWLGTGHANPAEAVIVACRFASDRLPRHPHPLLVASNGDLRRPLEKFIAPIGIDDAFDAMLLGARELRPELLEELWDRLLSEPFR